MLSWNALASVIYSQSSLGLVGYYQKIVKGFSKTSKPMTKLLEEEKKLKCTLLVKLLFRSSRSD
jgi:hypothetical protein